MENKKPNPQRLTAITGLWPATNGRAFVVRMDLSGTTVDVELDDDGLKVLLKAVMQASTACATMRDDLKPVPDADPASGVHMPVSDINVLPVKGAFKRVVLRVGSIDFNVMVGSAPAAKALAAALLS